MMNCKSIVLKLFGWEQVHEIIRESIATRLHASRYLIRNAGTKEMNGIYEGTFKIGDVPKYVKRPAPDAPEGGNTFTLFRCTMRTKQKWWFLSVADLEKPGTDKDVDYYQHKSTLEQEGEPPVFGWIVSIGEKAPGIDPPLFYADSSLRLF
jgi:ubiquitin carboxyl-terminal hydrolase 9/24